jgi:MFS family permease
VLRAFSTENLTAVRVAVFFQGVVISLMSLAPNVGLTFLGAVGFGAGAAAALAAGMSYLQSRLSGEARLLAFAGFHVVIRAGLALAAIGAGVAGDIVEGVEWPLVGELSAPRLVLFVSGGVVVLGSLLARSVERAP